MAEPADPDRLTKLQAAAVLEVSERTVEQYVKDGKLDPRRWRPAGGGQWRTVFLAEDVARLAAERQGGPPTPFLVPPTAGPTNAATGNGYELRNSAFLNTAGVPSGEDILRLVFAMAQRAMTGAALLEAPKEAPKDPKGPKFLTLAEASAESGMSERWLRRRIGKGTLKAEREPRSQWTAEDRGWRIRRRDLEQL